MLLVPAPRVDREIFKIQIIQKIMKILMLPMLYCLANKLHSDSVKPRNKVKVCFIKIKISNLSINKLLMKTGSLSFINKAFLKFNIYHKRILKTLYK